jgi:hypothetical protein
MSPAPEVAWRVSPVLTSDGTVRERHAFLDLSGHTSTALCQHTAFTAQLEPDDVKTASLCHLCWQFVGTDLVRQYGDRHRLD